MIQSQATTTTTAIHATAGSGLGSGLSSSASSATGTSVNHAATCSSISSENVFFDPSSGVGGSGNGGDVATAVVPSAATAASDGLFGLPSHHHVSSPQDTLSTAFELLKSAYDLHQLTVKGTPYSPYWCHLLTQTHPPPLITTLLMNTHL